MGKVVEAVEAVAADDVDEHCARCVERHPRAQCRDWARPLATSDSEDMSGCVAVGEREYPGGGGRKERRAKMDAQGKNGRLCVELDWDRSLSAYSSLPLTTSSLSVHRFGQP
jgi:hypothetical protein